MHLSIMRTGRAATALRAVSGAIALTLCCGAAALGQNADLQQKVAALKQSTAENQQRLHQYQWTETVQITLKGDPKPPKQNLCQYGPTGQVQKTPIGDQQPQQPSGGRFKQRIVEKKTAEMQDYMGNVKGVLSMYVPPDAQKLQAAFQAGNASISPANGAVNLVFKNYAQPGDQMTITFNPQAKEDYCAEREHIHRHAEPGGNAGRPVCQPARRNQLCAAKCTERDSQATGRYYYEFGIPEARTVSD